jgi:hypothetical protein
MMAVCLWMPGMSREAVVCETNRGVDVGDGYAANAIALGCGRAGWGRMRMRGFALGMDGLPV